MTRPPNPIVAAVVDLAEQALAGLPASDQLQRARDLHLRAGQPAVMVAAGLAVLTMSEHLEKHPGTALAFRWLPPDDGGSVLLALGGHARAVTLSHDVIELLTLFIAADPAVAKVLRSVGSKHKGAAVYVLSDITANTLAAQLAEGEAFPGVSASVLAGLASWADS